MTPDELRTKYLPGVPCWVDTTQVDVDGAVAFYGRVFGWTFDERPTPVPEARYLVASKDGQVVGGLGTPPPGDEGGPRWTTFVTVPDADAAVARILEAGGTLRSAAADAGPAGRSALCVDPQGAEIGLWQARRRIGAERVNADGAWNWSDLVTTDAEAARGFYESVFPWRARTVALGGSEATMWCVDGYGDALADLDPTRDERHGADHVPEGFADAIGWLEESVDGPAHWRVTFAVDDPDEVVRRVEAGGGAVLVAPFEVGPVRLATVADPAGAAFLVSRYQP